VPPTTTCAEAKPRIPGRLAASRRFQGPPEPRRRGESTWAAQTYPEPARSRQSADTRSWHRRPLPATEGRSNWALFFRRPCRLMPPPAQAATLVLARTCSALGRPGWWPTLLRHQGGPVKGQRLAPRPRRAGGANRDKRTGRAGTAGRPRGRTGELRLSARRFRRMAYVAGRPDHPSTAARGGADAGRTRAVHAPGRRTSTTASSRPAQSCGRELQYRGAWTACILVPTWAKHSARKNWRGYCRPPVRPRGAFRPGLFVI